MKEWTYKLNIKQYLTDSLVFEDIVQAGKSIGDELNRLPSTLIQSDVCFWDDIDFLTGLSIEDSDIYTSKELQDEINFRLSSIYDFADYHNVWLG